MTSWLGYVASHSLEARDGALPDVNCYNSRETRQLSLASIPRASRDATYDALVLTLARAADAGEAGQPDLSENGARVTSHPRIALDLDFVTPGTPYDGASMAENAAGAFMSTCLVDVRDWMGSLVHALRHVIRLPAQFDTIVCTRYGKAYSLVPAEGDGVMGESLYRVKFGVHVYFPDLLVCSSMRKVILQVIEGKFASFQRVVQAGDEQKTVTVPRYSFSRIQTSDLIRAAFDGGCFSRVSMRMCAAASDGRCYLPHTVYRFDERGRLGEPLWQAPEGATRVQVLESWRTTTGRPLQHLSIFPSVAQQDAISRVLCAGEYASEAATHSHYMHATHVAASVFLQRAFLRVAPHESSPILRTHVDMCVLEGLLRRAGGCDAVARFSVRAAFLVCSNVQCVYVVCRGDATPGRVAVYGYKGDTFYVDFLDDANRAPVWLRVDVPTSLLLDSPSSIGASHDIALYWPILSSTPAVHTNYEETPGVNHIVPTGDVGYYADATEDDYDALDVLDTPMPHGKDFLDAIGRDGNPRVLQRFHHVPTASVKYDMDTLVRDVIRYAHADPSVLMPEPLLTLTDVCDRNTPANFTASLPDILQRANAAGAAIDLDDEQRRYVFFVTCGHGGGKTRCIESVVAERSHRGRVAWAAPRRTLTADAKNRLDRVGANDVVHYEDKRETALPKMQARGHHALVLCTESFHKLELFGASYDVIVIDEVNAAGRDHASKMADEMRRENDSARSRALARARLTFVLDADFDANESAFSLVYDMVTGSAGLDVKPFHLVHIRNDSYDPWSAARVSVRPVALDVGSLDALFAIIVRRMRERKRGCGFFVSIAETKKLREYARKHYGGTFEDSMIMDVTGESTRVQRAAIAAQLARRDAPLFLAFTTANSIGVSYDVSEVDGTPLFNYKTATFSDGVHVHDQLQGTGRARVVPILYYAMTGACANAHASDEVHLDDELRRLAAAEDDVDVKHARDYCASPASHIRRVRLGIENAKRALPDEYFDVEAARRHGPHAESRLIYAGAEARHPVVLRRLLAVVVEQNVQTPRRMTRVIAAYLSTLGYGVYRLKPQARSQDGENAHSAEERRNAALDAVLRKAMSRIKPMIDRCVWSANISNDIEILRRFGVPCGHGPGGLACYERSLIEPRPHPGLRSRLAFLTQASILEPALTTRVGLYSLITAFENDATAFLPHIHDALRRIAYTRDNVAVDTASYMSNRMRDHVCPSIDAALALTLVFDAIGLRDGLFDQRLYEPRGDPLNLRFNVEYMTRAASMYHVSPMLHERITPNARQRRRSLDTLFGPPQSDAPKYSPMEVLEMLLRNGLATFLSGSTALRSTDDVLALVVALKASGDAQSHAIAVRRLVREVFIGFFDAARRIVRADAKVARAAGHRNVSLDDEVRALVGGQFVRMYASTYAQWLSRGDGSRDGSFEAILLLRESVAQTRGGDDDGSLSTLCRRIGNMFDVMESAYDWTEATSDDLKAYEDAKAAGTLDELWLAENPHDLCTVAKVKQRVRKLQQGGASSDDVDMDDVDEDE